MTTGGAFGIQDFAGDFFDLNPFSGGSVRARLPGTPSASTYNALQLWVLLVGWSLVALAACSSASWCAARGAGC